MKTNEELLNYLVNIKLVKTSLLKKAFSNIDRKNFVLEKHINDAYLDTPLPIGNYQTISAPSVVWFMLELLKIQKNERVLDVWSGSGYTTALIAEIVWNKWEVIWVERVLELVEFWQKNLEKYDFKNVKIIEYKENFINIENNFDKILVSAAADSLPKKLLKKLSKWWIMVVPVGNLIYKVNKISDEKVEIQEYWYFSFVPLIY